MGIFDNVVGDMKKRLDQSMNEMKQRVAAPFGAQPQAAPAPQSAPQATAAPQTAGQFCGECGENIEAGGKFCPSCGAAQPQAAAVPQTPPQTPPVPSAAVPPLVPAAAAQGDPHAEYQPIDLFDFNLAWEEKRIEPGKYTVKVNFCERDGTTLLFTDIEDEDTIIRLDIKQRPPKLESNQTVTIFFHSERGSHILDDMIIH